MMRIVRASLAILLGMVAPAAARAAVEEPRFQVLERRQNVELRLYGPRIAAETTVRGEASAARNAGFRNVAGYIFGANRAKTSIAMTAPVAQAPVKGSGQKIAMTAPVAQVPAPSGDGGSWKVQFFMPSSWTMQSLPAPTNPDVRLVEVPAQRYAVLRFSGLASDSAVRKRTSDLMAVVAAAGWKAEGAPVVWFYDPPWTLPPLRRNEVAVLVTD